MMTIAPLFSGTAKIKKSFTVRYGVKDVIDVGEILKQNEQRIGNWPEGVSVEFNGVGEAGNWREDGNLSIYAKVHIKAPNGDSFVFSQGDPEVTKRSNENLKTFVNRILDLTEKLSESLQGIGKFIE
jgi:hypothetical protein